MYLLFCFIVLLVTSILLICKFNNNNNNITPTKTDLMLNVNMNNNNVTYIQSSIFKRENIVKKIYRTWCNNKIPFETCGGRLGEQLPFDITKNNMPGWEQIIYNHEERLKFIHNEFDENSTISIAYSLINPIYSAAQADLFRYLIIYKYGGLYLDFKSCIVKELPDIPKDKDLWISNWSDGKPQKHLFTNGEYQQWYIYGRKNAPILADIINYIVTTIINLHNYPNNELHSITPNETISKGSILALTGPIAFTIAINKSKHKNTCYYSNSINKYIKYNCNKNQNIISGHYSKYDTYKYPVIYKNINLIYIPKKIYMTYNNIDKIPLYVKDNIKKYCFNYDVEIYDDNMCLNFLKKFYGEKAGNIFNNFKHGAHKADFFRYCILYIFGGYYFDIKTHFIKHIDAIFDSKVNNTWYTVLCENENKKSIYNCIIVTPKYNPIIYDNIKYIYENPNPKIYHTYIDYMYKTIINSTYNNTINIGENELKNNYTCIIFKEVCKKCDKNEENCDRYNLKCHIINQNNEHIFNTRYNNYPW